MPDPRPLVHSIAVELTAECNQRCRYCYNPSRAGRQGSGTEPSGATASESAADANSHGRIAARLDRLLHAWQVDHVTLTGGEPFAQPELWTVLELLRQHQVPAQIISNGGLITEPVAARLAPFGVRYVQITLNGPNAAVHAEHTGDERHFEGAIGGVRALQRHGVAVVGCIVVTHRNATHVAKTLERWQALGVWHVALSRFSPAGQAVEHAARLLPTRGDMIDALEQAQPFARDGMQLSCTMPIPPCMIEVSDYAPIRFGSCAIGTGKQEFALGADGGLRNCTLHRRPIGGVDDLLDRAVDLARLVEAREITGYADGLPEFCEGCVHGKSCGGGCGAAADWMLHLEGRRMPDPFLWQHIDDELAERLGRSND